MHYNVASHLARLASEEPYRPAVIFPQGRDAEGRVVYTHYTFEQLHEESDRLAHGLKQIGVSQGMRTVLMVTPSLEFFALTFSLFKLGAVPVLIDPGMGIRHLGKCLAEAEPEAFIGIPKAHVARQILGWGRKSIRLTVSTGSKFLKAQWSLTQLREKSRGMGAFPLFTPKPDEMAAILFTSGSTGIAKGVVYTHGIFTAQVEMLKEIYGIQPGERDLATFPLFALFGPALGMTAIIPEMDATRPAQVDPKKIREAIENFGVTNLFGSPALINRVGRVVDEQQLRFPSLKRVISAGAPVPAKVIERFVKCLPEGTQVFTPYGATESLPVASIGSDMILKQTRFETENGAGVCVGFPVPRMKVRIIPIREEAIPQFDDSLALPTGQIGEICVNGPVVTKQYFNRPEATEKSKIVDSGSGEVWHRMGDVGYLDSQGRLWFCGRKSQRVVTEQGPCYTIPCEAIFNNHPDVFRSALVGVEFEKKTHPVICVEPEASARRRSLAQWRKELLPLAEAHPHTRCIKTILLHSRFPVDIRHNAKIFREKLAVWAARQLEGEGWRPSPLTEMIPHPPVSGIKEPQ